MFPVFRQNGHFHLISTPSKNGIHFKHIDNYREREEDRYMQFDYYDEFLKDKGVALLRGKIFEKSLSKTEAWRVM